MLVPFVDALEVELFARVVRPANIGLRAIVVPERSTFAANQLAFAEFLAQAGSHAIGATPDHTPRLGERALTGDLAELRTSALVVAGGDARIAVRSGGTQPVLPAGKRAIAPLLAREAPAVARRASAPRGTLLRVKAIAVLSRLAASHARIGGGGAASLDVTLRLVAAFVHLPRAVVRWRWRARQGAPRADGARRSGRRRGGGGQIAPWRRFRARNPRRAAHDEYEGCHDETQTHSLHAALQSPLTHSPPTSLHLPSSRQARDLRQSSLEAALHRPRFTAHRPSSSQTPEARQSLSDRSAHRSSRRVQRASDLHAFDRAQSSSDRATHRPRTAVQLPCAAQNPDATQSASDTSAQTFPCCVQRAFALQTRDLWQSASLAATQPEGDEAQRPSRAQRGAHSGRAGVGLATIAGSARSSRAPGLSPASGASRATGLT